jgi:hypothetical protein
MSGQSYFLVALTPGRVSAIWTEYEYLIFERHILKCESWTDIDAKQESLTNWDRNRKVS